MMPHRMDRRDFVCTCALGAAAVALGGCASLITRPVTPVNGRLELALVHYPELVERGGSLRVMPVGHGEPVYILAHEDGSFSAVSPVCTHLGCTVEIEGERLVCPCHGSTYDRRGTVLQGPAQQSLARYRTSVGADGILIVDLRSRT